jgi:hypothetical protein
MMAKALSVTGEPCSANNDRSCCEYLLFLTSAHNMGRRPAASMLLAKDILHGCHCSVAQLYRNKSHVGRLPFFCQDSALHAPWFACLHVK